MPENVDGVRLFNSCQTQRRYTPSGRLLGFDYSSVKTVAELLSIDDVSDAFYCMQVMENELIEISIQQNRAE